MPFLPHSGNKCIHPSGSFPRKPRRSAYRHGPTNHLLPSPYMPIPAPQSATAYRTTAGAAKR
jgi:hypothetical protein